MKRSFFADTSAWLAAVSPRLVEFAAARGAWATLRAEVWTAMTTNLVIAEMHAMLASRHDADAALHYLDEVYSDPATDVVHVDHELQTVAADRWLRPYSDHRFSLCDAVSFEVMRREGITRAFTLDRHFAIAGFEMIPGPLPQPKRRR